MRELRLLLSPLGSIRLLLIASGHASPRLALFVPAATPPATVDRLSKSVLAALAKPDYTRLYTGEERGYIDYPGCEPVPVPR